MNERDTQKEVQEVEEISAMLKTLPQETRRGFYYAIKGACLVSDAKAVETDKHTA